jgi:hypothetical protein
VDLLNALDFEQVWTEPGVAAKEANLLPTMVSEDQAKRVEFKPISLTGVINFF